MLCDDVLDLVEAIAGGELMPNRDVAVHLESCAACRAALERARTIEHMLQSRSLPQPPAHFTARTLARVRRARWRSEQIFDLGFNLALLLLAVAVGGGIWMLVHQS